MAVLDHRTTMRVFKERVHAGSRLMGYSTNLIFTVTAVGRDKFLYLDSYDKERVATISGNQAHWRLIEDDQPIELCDYSGHRISTAVGFETICSVGIDGFLTRGRYYKITGLRVDEGRVVIEKDDRGLEGWYRSTRFSV